MRINELQTKDTTSYYNKQMHEKRYCINLYRLYVQKCTIFEIIFKYSIYGERNSLYISLNLIRDIKELRTEMVLTTSQLVLFL